MVGTGLSSGRLALGCNIHTSGPRPGWQGAVVVSLWSVAHFSTYHHDFPLTLDLGTPSHAVTPYLAWGLSNIHYTIHMVMLKLWSVVYICWPIPRKAKESSLHCSSVVFLQTETRSRQWYALNDSSVQPKTFINQAGGNQFFEILMRPPVTSQHSAVSHIRCILHFNDQQFSHYELIERLNYF